MPPPRLGCPNLERDDIVALCPRLMPKVQTDREDEGKNERKKNLRWNTVSVVLLLDVF